MPRPASPRAIGCLLDGLATMSPFLLVTSFRTPRLIFVGYLVTSSGGTKRLERLIESSWATRIDEVY